MEAVTDLAPVLEAVNQLALIQIIGCGILLGCTVAVILAVMFRC